ncbi:MAG TPA: carboxylesterase family protein [Acidobacteriaceae bacterium]
MRDFFIARRRFLQGTALYAGAALLPRATPLFATTSTPIATTTYGKISGAVDNGVMVFKGVPYGADTAGRRFQPPAPLTPWTGVRIANEFGPRAPQGGGRGVMGGPATISKRGYYLPPELGDISEDCLHLNVWTTALRDHRKRPVLFYIHGGAFSSGSANNVLYDGVRLAKRGDVVVVTINHRLNVFGYLYLAQLSTHPELADAGNAGMLDIILALQWVRDNIAEFGGDPQRVLIFGQSGGGAKCATLMGMPAARGLFHRVISMSGQQITAARPESATTRAMVLLKALELTPARVDELRTMPMEKLVAASRSAGYMGPVKDGRSMPRDPFAPDAPPLSAHVPMILGNAHDETRVLIGGGDPSLFSLTWEALPAKLEVVRPFLGDLKADDVVAKYRAIYPQYSASDVFFAATTAFRSWRGELIESERRAAQPVAAARTWVYQIDWRSPVDGGKFGAPHTMDIPFMFDNTAMAPGMCGDDASALPLAHTMSSMVAAFAQTGDPNSHSKESGLPHWPVYDLKTRATMIFDNHEKKTRVMDDPRGAERQLVETVMYTQPGT